MKKLLLFAVLCISFSVNAEAIMPDGLIYAAPVEQDEKACSVILANDSGESMAISSYNTDTHFEDATLEKNRTSHNKCGGGGMFLSVESVLSPDLSPLKPDKRVNL